MGAFLDGLSWETNKGSTTAVGGYAANQFYTLEENQRLIGAFGYWPDAYLRGGGYFIGEDFLSTEMLGGPYPSTTPF